MLRRVAKDHSKYIIEYFDAVLSFCVIIYLKYIKRFPKYQVHLRGIDLCFPKPEENSFVSLQDT